MLLLLIPNPTSIADCSGSLRLPFLLIHLMGSDCCWSLLDFIPFAKRLLCARS